MPVTPNMDLILPTPTDTPGPTYATQNNTAFTAVDAHDHTTGKGLQVPSAGIGIDADLPFNNKNATIVRTVRFYNQAAALGEGSDLGCVYAAGGNLFFNDSSGTQIQLTAGGALNAASIGGIGGDYATSSASVFYSSVSKTFYFTQDTNTPANIDAGNIVVREPVVSSNSVTIASASSLASSYTMTLPAAVPASTRILSMTASGAVATGAAGTIVAADLSAGCVTDAACGALTTAALSAAAGILKSQVQAVGQQVTTGITGTVTNTSNQLIATVVITTQGKPVRVFLGGDSPTVRASLRLTNEVTISLDRGGSFVQVIGMGGPTDGGTSDSPPGAFDVVDFSVVGSSGSHTYSLYAKADSGGNQIQFTNCKLVAYELV